MKTIGIIGGIGPESTIEYYRQIIASYRERTPNGSYPSVIINSVDLQRLLGLMTAGDFPSVTEYLVEELARLARAGAECGLLAANSPHLVFDELHRRSPIPLLSIVAATCRVATGLGLTRVGLLGTRFTMEGGFYQSVFSKEGMTVVVPEPAERAYLHDKYLSELLQNVFRPETHDGLQRIVDGLLQRESIQGVILAGTELPLILPQTSYRGIPFLDTTRIHAEAMVVEALS